MKAHFILTVNSNLFFLLDQNDKQLSCDENDGTFLTRGTYVRSTTVSTAIVRKRLQPERLSA